MFGLDPASWRRLAVTTLLYFALWIPSSHARKPVVKFTNTDYGGITTNKAFEIKWNTLHFEEPLLTLNLYNASEQANQWLVVETINSWIVDKNHPVNEDWTFKWTPSNALPSGNYRFGIFYGSGDIVLSTEWLFEMSGPSPPDGGITTAPVSDEGNGSGLSAGAKAGIGAGVGVVGLAVLALAGAIIHRRREIARKRGSVTTNVQEHDEEKFDGKAELSNEVMPASWNEMDGRPVLEVHGHYIPLELSQYRYERSVEEAGELDAGAYPKAHHDGISQAPPIGSEIK